MGKMAIRRRFARWKPELVSETDPYLPRWVLLTTYKPHCRHNWRPKDSTRVLPEPAPLPCLYPPIQA